MSPGTARADRTLKRRLYQRQGVPEYWIVDVGGRLVERWKPDDDRPELVTGRLGWWPVAGHPALSIDIEEYFLAVIGE